MLIGGKEVLAYATENKIGIPAFGCVNLEGIKSIVDGAAEFDTPVILQMTEGGIKYAGLEILYAAAVTAATNSKAKICIHLDHGRDLDLVKKAIDLGFNSVMYDGSFLPIEENIANSKIIKDYIGDKDISLEVEIGTIGGKEDDIKEENSMYANIDEVVKMNEVVNPDSIAVAVGTSHGIYSGEIKIKYELITEAIEKTGKPVVLHGTSGVPTKMVQKCISYGVAKINYDTELKQQFIGGVFNYLKANPQEYDIRKIFQPGIDAQKEIVIQRIKDCKGA